MLGTSVRRRVAVGVAAVLTLAAVGAGVARARAQVNFFTVHPLVSDAATVPAPGTDASLVNGWGLSAGPTTPWWAANNGSNTSTLYSGAGAKTALTVTVAGGPTGTVFNGNAAAFVVSQDGKSGGRAIPVRDRGRHDHGLVADRQRHRRRHRRRPLGGRARSTRASRSRTTSCTRPTSTTGASTSSTSRSTSSPGGFTDPKIPKGFAPFGIQALGGQHLRHLREAGCREEGRRRAPRPGVRRRVHARRRAGRTGRELAARRTRR